MKDGVKLHYILKNRMGGVDVIKTAQWILARDEGMNTPKEYRARLKSWPQIAGKDWQKR